MAVRVCQWCGGTFESIRFRVTCSEPCARAHEADRRRRWVAEASDDPDYRAKRAAYERQRRAQGRVKPYDRTPWREMTFEQQERARAYQREWAATSPAAVEKRRRRAKLVAENPEIARRVMEMARQARRERNRQRALIMAATSVEAASQREPDRAINIDDFVTGFHDMAMDQIAETALSETSPSALADMTTAALRERLAAAITVSARGIYETALIFEELRRRGEPMDDLRLSLAPYLPRIARGEIAAEAVVALAGFRSALNRVALLPIGDQRDILARKIDVVSAIIDDRPTVVQRGVVEMTARDVALVIADDGHIRDVSAQVEHLRSGRAARAARPRAGSAKPRGIQPAISIDGDYVRVGRQAVRTAHLVDQLTRLGVIK